MADEKKAPIDEKRARELLDRERERIESELEARAKALGVEVEQLMDEIAAEDDARVLEEQQKDAALLRSLASQLQGIERAEKRLEDGTYGFSVDSGEPIPAKRLEAIPWAERTKDEEQR
jgi:DnaK suppressor protein